MHALHMLLSFVAFTRFFDADFYADIEDFVQISAQKMLDGSSVRKSILHSKLTDVHLRSFSWQIEFFLPFLEPMSLALAIFHLHEHNTSGFEVSGMVHCVHWENATIFCWCSRTQAFQKYKVPATFEGFVASLKNCNITFRKWGEGVKDRLEIFRKFIRFGGATWHPSQRERRGREDSEVKTR